MKRKKYEKPTMGIVYLNHHPQLLAGSGFDGNRNPYGDPTSW